MIYVKLTGRQFTPGLVEVGMSLDVNAETVHFTVQTPHDAAFDEDCTARVYWLNPLGARGFTALTLTEDEDENLVGQWVPPKAALESKGILQAEIRLVKTVDDEDVIVWHSEPLRLNVSRSLEDEAGSTTEIPKYKTVTATAEELGYGEPPTATVEQGSDSIAFAFGLPAGHPGVYVGHQTPPDGYTVWIDPQGEDDNILRLLAGTEWIGVPSIVGPAASIVIASPTGSGNAITAMTAISGTITPEKGNTFVDSIESTGSGNVVSAVTLSGSKITFKKNVTALTSHQDISGLQTKAITDTGGYFTTDTVEGALQELGAALDGLDTALADLL